MTPRRAVIVSVLTGLMIGFAVVLSSGIDALDLHAGRMVETEKSGTVFQLGTRGENRDVTLPSDRLFTVLVLAFLAAALLSAIFMVIDRKARPKFFTWLLALAVLVLVGVFVPNQLREDEDVARPEEETPTEEARPVPTLGTERQLTVAPPDPSSDSRWPIIVTAFLAAALGALSLTPLALFLIRRIRRRRRSGAEEVLAIAEDAAKEIESGGNPIGVVQRCYARMLHALSQSSGIDPEYRTPREFAVDMRAAGLHHESVDALTEMFELVRYGGRADAPLAQRAVACLSALRLSHEPS